jgi:Domain of unknown function (DUF1707)
MSNDPPDLRASHADRERVVDALRVAGGDGRLSAEELDTGWRARFQLKLDSENAAADPRLRIELVGKLLHAKVIEQRA